MNKHAPLIFVVEELDGWSRANLHENFAKGLHGSMAGRSKPGSPTGAINNIGFPDLGTSIHNEIWNSSRKASSLRNLKGEPWKHKSFMS